MSSIHFNSPLILSQNRAGNTQPFFASTPCCSRALGCHSAQGTQEVQLINFHIGYRPWAELGRKLGVSWAHNHHCNQAGYRFYIANSQKRLQEEPGGMHDLSQHSRFPCMAFLPQKGNVEHREAEHNQRHGAQSQLLGFGGCINGAQGNCCFAEHRSFP